MVLQNEQDYFNGEAFMRMNNRGFGVVEVIIILAVMIVLAMVFGDDISKFIADMIMRLS